MNSNSKKIIVVSTLPVIPMLALVFRNFIFYRKGWDTVQEIQYQTVFWAARILLTPLVVFYTIRYWMELGRVFKVLAVQLGGFILYLVLHFIISFSIYQLAIDWAYYRVWNLSRNIFEDSFLLNLFIYLVTVFVFYVWEYFERNQEVEKKSLLLEKSLALSRLEVLSNQLNSHFLFNTLHTISSLIMQERKDEANQTLINLSHLLRFSLLENKGPFIPLHKEVELTRLYLNIQKERFKDRLQYEFIYNVAINDIPIPALLLQPLVENAIEYAIEPFTGAGKITIRLEVLKEFLSIQVKDTGKLPFEKINFEEGIGIKNTKERLLALYGSTFRFLIFPVEPAPGVVVSIDLPVQ